MSVIIIACFFLCFLNASNDTKTRTMTHLKRALSSCPFLEMGFWCPSLSVFLSLSTPSIGVSKGVVLVFGFCIVSKTGSK